MLLAADWGSSHCRLALLSLADGTVLAERQLACGVLTHQPVDAPALLKATAADWLAKASQVVLGGMIGSEAGWHYVPQQQCPAGLAEQAAAAMRLPAAVSAPLTEAPVWLCAGLKDESVPGLPQRMRGEELQILGTGQQQGWLCLPGTHSKWALLADGQVQQFRTFLTGELYAQSLQLPSLKALVGAVAPQTEPMFCRDSFCRGVALAQQLPGLSQLWFAARCLLLEQAATAEEKRLDARSLLSGLVIGDELRQQLPLLGPASAGAPLLTLVADGQLRLCYQLAFEQLGLTTPGIHYQTHASQASCWRGIWLLAKALTTEELHHA